MKSCTYWALHGGKKAEQLRICSRLVWISCSLRMCEVFLVDHSYRYSRQISLHQEIEITISNKLGIVYFLALQEETIHVWYVPGGIFWQVVCALEDPHPPRFPFLQFAHLSIDVPAQHNSQIIREGCR